MDRQSILPDLYFQIVECIKSTGGYLVGGAVRDLLLNKPVYDLDFALPADSIRISRLVADQLRGDFFILDQERQTARVILRDKLARRVMVDFSVFQGSDLEEDLRSRDFTITSMALDIMEGDQVIDHFGGAQDLKQGLIRSTTPDSIKADPLRCLRAVRMAAQYKFRILDETKEQIRKYQSGISEISPERIRDEVFRILSGPNQSTALQSLDRLGLYERIFKGRLSTPAHQTIRGLERLWLILLSPHNQEIAANWHLGALVERLGRYRDELAEHLDQELVSGRSAYQLSFLTPLIGEIGFSGARKSGEVPPALSNQEMDRISKSFLAAKAFEDLVENQGQIVPIRVYRYFKSFGAAGVEGVFLALAARIGKGPHSLDDRWLEVLEKSRTLLEGWWEMTSQWVDPPVLISGDDLIKELGLDPGPRIGDLLESLREAQVQEGLVTKDQAWKFMRELFSSTGESEDD